LPAFKKIASHIWNKTPEQCFYRYHSSFNGLKKEMKLWSVNDDITLLKWCAFLFFTYLTFLLEFYLGW
jgi:hypothetical protein